jgi:chromosome segregation ATPase
MENKVKLNRTKLKGLQTQIAKLESEISLSKGDISTKQKELSIKTKSLSELKSELQRLQGNNGLIVSEHAILRYLERCKGLNISEVVDEIKNETIMDLYDKLGGSGTYPCEAFKAILKNNIIVTIEEL